MNDMHKKYHLAGDYCGTVESHMHCGITYALSCTRGTAIDRIVSNAQCLPYMSVERLMHTATGYAYM